LFARLEEGIPQGKAERVTRVDQRNATKRPGDGRGRRGVKKKKKQGRTTGDSSLTEFEFKAKTAYGGPALAKKKKSRKGLERRGGAETKKKKTRSASSYNTIHLPKRERPKKKNQKMTS